LCVARNVGFTRDPFDRLLVRHAVATRLKIATADHALLEHLSADLLYEL
jgi:PIN domain nuclease of toxin-antitoxin system